MDNFNSTVMIIHPLEITRVLWQQVLESQQISVSVIAEETNLIEMLVQLEQSGVTLPKVILIDQKLPFFNPVIFCDWCREHHPNLQIILLSPSSKQILEVDRQAVINYGVFDLLPAFQLENLAVGVIFGVKRVLAALPSQPLLQKDLLVSKLMLLKREIESGNLINLNSNNVNYTPNLTQTQFSANLPSFTAEIPLASPPINTVEVPKPSKRKYRGASY